MSSARTVATFAITYAQFYVPVVTLKQHKTIQNTRLLSNWFKRSIYWNEYKVTPKKNYDADEYIRERLDAKVLIDCFSLYEGC